VAKPLIWFTGANGLNNRVDPVRLPFNPETGVQDLATAYNVHFDNTGRPSRRKGYTVTNLQASSHSLFCEGGDCLFVTGNALSVLGTDFSSIPIRNVAEGLRMRYAQVGSKVYYCNGVQNGYVKGGISFAWSKPATVYNQETTRQYSQAPVGSLLSYYNGRMYIGQGDTIWFSEPFGVRLYDLSRSFIHLPGTIVMLRAVESGLFVSDNISVYFFKGDHPEEFKQTEVATYPAIRGTDIKIDASVVGEPTIFEHARFSGIAAMWTSAEGICLGLPDGSFQNLTERRLTYPFSHEGAALYTRDRYIATLEP